MDSFFKEKHKNPILLTSRFLMKNNITKNFSLRKTSPNLFVHLCDENKNQQPQALVFLALYIQCPAPNTVILALGAWFWCGKNSEIWRSWCFLLKFHPLKTGNVESLISVCFAENMVAARSRIRRQEMWKSTLGCKTSMHWRTVSVQKKNTAGSVSGESFRPLEFIPISHCF